MTQTQTKTISEIAEEMLDNMHWQERDNKTKYVCCKDSIDWQRDIIHLAHADRFPDDSTYRWIYHILESLVDSDCEDEDSARDTVNEIEPDVYTFDLTKWLNARVDHVYYLTQALEEYDSKDGFQALQIAQKCYIEEIGHALIDGIVKHIETL